MLASRWSLSVGTNLWPLGIEELRIFRENLWKMWNAELTCVWKASVLIAFVVFFPLQLGRPISTCWEPHSCCWCFGRGRSAPGSADWAGWQQNCPTGNPMGGRGTVRWEILDPVVSVVKRKHWSAYFEITRRAHSPANPPFIHKLPDPTVVLGTTSLFSLLSDSLFLANNQWCVKLNVLLKGALVPP